MADVLLERLSELRTIPPEQHLFCPRVGDDDYSTYFDEDIAAFPPETDPDVIAERVDKIKQAQERKWLAFDAMQILAYNDEDAKPHRDWLTERLSSLMTSCDVCVRVFHQSRAEWKNRLVDQYDEENVVDFLRVIDDLCIERISSGLGKANAALAAAEPKDRSVRLFDKVGINEATYAFFEALSCDALIRNEDLLRTHFDRPFQLVQTNPKKRLKLQTIVPAMTRFLFSHNTERQTWATLSWMGCKRNILPSEFDWAVRDHLVDAMMRVQLTSLELPFTAVFWAGVKLIITRLDKELITHSIRGLEGDFYKLILDNLSLRTDGYLDLIDTIKLLLEKSPVDFWDGMNAVTPSIATVVEQVLNSPVLKQLLLSANEHDEHSKNLDAAFAWVAPLLYSLKPANLTAACKTLTNYLLNHFQSDKYSRLSRERCFKEGLRVLNITFTRMNEGKTMAQFVGQPTVNGMLGILSTHIEPIVTSLKRFGDDQHQEELQLALSMIQQAFTLESQSLAVERQLISAEKPSPTETPPSSPIWKALLRAIDAKSMDLATHLLIAGRNLIGLEPLSMKKGHKIPPTVHHFNQRFKLLSQTITDVIDRLAEFDAKQLDILFEQPAAASALISSLFSSTEETRNSSVELLKVISAQEERRDALQHILRAHYKNVLQGVSDSGRQIMRKKAFAPAPSLIKTCSDIIDVMCNSQDGILRSRTLATGEGEGRVTMTLWKNLWDTLTMIFRTTEDWSNLGFYDKAMMMDFCRDTMQFADQLFDQCSIFSTALTATITDPDDSSSETKLLQELLDLPAKTMEGMAKWLRLRDEFLSSKSVSLISKLLVRLQKVSIEVDADTLSYIERVLSGDIRAKLSMQQEAELIRALETHLGHSIAKAEEPVKQQKQGSISKFITGASASESKAKDADERAKLIANLSPAARAFQAKREAIRERDAKAVKQTDEAKSAQQNEFKRRRQLEQERIKQERAAAAAKAKQSRGFSEHTAEAGSGLEGLGVLGKDQAPKGEGLMHSSDESDEDGDFDEDLFGIKKERRPKSGPKTNIINEIKIQQPVKKRRVVRSVKDMRARLAPDLSPLHKVILSWDYFHNGDFPPNSAPDIYSRVPKTFRTAVDYRSTFEPLLTLEAWQGFVKNREENGLKPYDIKIVSRASVDAFQEVSSTMTHAENRELFISEGDIVLLSQSKSPSVEDRYCLARVFRVQRKQAHVEVSYRIMPSNPLQSSLVPNGTVYGSKVQSITPLEREYGALLGLQYYDLCDEICRAKPSPLLQYKDSQLELLVSNYNVNKAQAKAVKSAIDNDAFTLIQGPPGSGKTKTIVAIVGAILSDSLRYNGTPVHVPGQGSRSDTASKKLLVCAPSNAAVDELVMRFKDGVKTLSGQERKVNIVRIGRSDAINANVQDVTLEELVNKKLGVNPSNGRDSEATRKIFDEHKKVSEQLRMVREQLDSGTVKGPDASKLQDVMNDLRRQKALLGTKIDNAKDNERLASRNAELNRRRAQEQILGDAHVICATLSGSGHEMFQGLSVEFETVIVDEAAQCVEMSALIPLKYGCAKCILVGDPKQLPPTVFSKEAARFQYEQSLFVRMQGNHPDDVHLLDTQYRMHPEISLFPSQTFYDGRLLDGDNMAGLRKRPWHTSSLLAPYRFFDVQGQHQAAPKGHSLINIAEINVALQLYKRLTSDFRNFDFKGKIGIITPYKSQLRELKNRFSQQYGPTIIEDVEFNTTDAFQGRESEVIIFSCVRASPAGGIGFLQDIRRMNVGLTRAKSSLWVLGNSQSLMRGEFWRKLVDDARRRDRYTEGNVPQMLNKHSSSYPAPAGSYDVPSHPAKVKQEVQSHPIKRSASDDSLASEKKPKLEIKQEIKREIKQEIKAEPLAYTKPVTNGKQKLNHLADVDEDVKMDDAFSEPSSRSNTASRQSTPASLANSTRNSATPVPEASKPSEPAATKPGDILGTMTKPKIRRRPREVDPFIKRQAPKKPKGG